MFSHRTEHSRVFFVERVNYKKITILYFELEDQKQKWIQNMRNACSKAKQDGTVRYSYLHIPPHATARIRFFSHIKNDLASPRSSSKTTPSKKPESKKGGFSKMLRKVFWSH